MLFAETLAALHPSVEQATEELFTVAFRNQTHPQDLLLVNENAGPNKIEITNPHLVGRVSGYGYGTGIEGFVEQCQSKFYSGYVNTTFSKVQVMQDIKTSQELQQTEENSIHLELLLYLKFWESESILKKLFQLTRLAMGQNFDWNFNFEEQTLHQLIRVDIRDNLKEICPLMYNLIEKAYLSQLRHVAAHSQYYFFFNTRMMHFSNYDPAKHNILKVMSFDDWEPRIHNVALLYSELNRCTHKYHEIYKTKAISNNNKLELRDWEGGPRIFQYDNNYDRWITPQ